MRKCIRMWIILLLSWMIFSPVRNIPIKFGQDPTTIDSSGYIAARDYEEWKECLGYNCPVRNEEKYYLQRLKCAMGIEENACANTVSNDDEEDALEHDIFLTPEEVKKFSLDILYKTRRRKRMAKYFPDYFLSNRRNKRKVTQYSESTKQWALPIRAIFDEHFTNNLTEKAEVLKAIAHWESQTCIRFQVEDPGTVIEGPYVVFSKGKICGSYIGQIPVYPQPLQLTTECLQLGSIAHEIGHMVGFWHEHQRTDRDNYVNIRGEYARTAKERILSLELKGSTANLVPYDYGSLMHYRAWAFTKDGEKTIEPIDKMYVQTLGQKVGLSYLDAKLANIAYCSNICQTPLPSACHHSGYQDPNACDRCRCPDGLGGTYCDSVAPSKNGDCSEIIDLEDGQYRKIYSPGYIAVQPYANNIECNWIVKSPPGYRILLIFDGSIFGVFCEKHTPVCFHWLEIKYRKDFSKTGPRICCHGFPMMTIRSEGPELILTMRANYETELQNRRGFVVTVKAERDCGQKYGRVFPKYEHPCPEETTPSPPTTNSPPHIPEKDDNLPPLQKLGTIESKPQNNDETIIQNYNENTETNSNSETPTLPKQEEKSVVPEVVNITVNPALESSSQEDLGDSSPALESSSRGDRGDSSSQEGDDSSSQEGDGSSSEDSDDSSSLEEADENENDECEFDDFDSTDIPGCVSDNEADQIPIRETVDREVTISLCTKMDFVILFDETWSPSVSFTLVIQFLQDIISKFNIGSDTVQLSVGFISFGPQSKIVFNFNELDTKDKLLQAMTSLQSLRGSTNVAGGFKDLTTMLSSSDGGHRPGVSMVCLVFLNSGSSADKHLTIPEAEKAREKNIYIFAIGTSWANRKELELITGDIHRVYFKNTVRILLSDDVAGSLHKDICDIKVKDIVKGTSDPEVLDSHMTEGVWSCDFDTTDQQDTVCGIHEDNKLNMNLWKIQQGQTQPGFNGPAVALSGSHYIYSGILGSSSSCANYFYGGTMDLLQLQIVLKYSDTVSKTLWKVSRYSQNVWILANVDVKLTKCPKIGFVANVIKGSTGGVAIDSIKLTAGHC